MKRIKRWVNKLFPLNVKTLEEFLKHFQKNGCSYVSAYVYVTLKNASTSKVIGRIGNCLYWVKLESETPGGRKIMLKKLVFERYGSTHGYADSKERTALLNKSLVEADNLLKEVKKFKPDVKPRFIQDNNTPFSEEEVEEIRGLSEKRIIEPPTP